jgi:heat-inducible transcriptional repressor
MKTRSIKSTSLTLLLLLVSASAWAQPTSVAVDRFLTLGPIPTPYPAFKGDDFKAAQLLSQPHLDISDWWPSEGDRLLVFLVQGPDFSTSLNLRLGAGLEEELPILERWSNQQLRANGDGRIPWERLPAELRRSGGLLRQALDSHGRIRSEELDAVVAAGLGGLLAQPEFSHSSSLLPVVQLVEHGPRALLGLTGNPAAIASDAIWIGTEHPHAALGQCSVVQATYRTGHGGRGQVALVGPMRMAYATARAAVQSVASILERLLS